MKAVIWDLDGTILDSYRNIASNLAATVAELGIQDDTERIRNFVCIYSVSKYISEIEFKTGKSFESVKERYSEISRSTISDITLMPHALDTLCKLNSKGIRNYVVTHRGTSTRAVLEHVGILGLFDEIITAADGFARKPDPEALHYLLQKYALNPAETYYVGDRDIDILCAVEAGIKSVLYQPDPAIAFPSVFDRTDFVIHDLNELPTML